MSKVKILCSSTGSIPYAPERYEKYGIGIIDLHVSFKGVDKLESDVDPDQFYADLETLENPRNNLPHTTLPSPLEIAEHFDKAIEEGYDEIIVYTISTGLSGTYNAVSLMAREYEDRIKVHVVNTHAAAFSEGIHAVRAAQMLEEGRSAEEIVKESEWAVRHQQFMGVDAKLDYLIYNGRLKGAKAFMGQMLKICPVLKFNDIGELIAVESVRTPKKALARLCEYIAGYIGDRDPKDYILFHVYTGPSLLETLKEIEGKYGLKVNHEPVVMTPASGSHNGPWFAGYGLYKIRREDEPLEE